MLRKIVSSLLRKLSAPIEVTVHSHIYLDGKQIAESVKRHQYERYAAERAFRQ